MFLEQFLVLALLVVVAAIDIRTRIIPDVIPAGIAVVHALFLCASGALGRDVLSPMVDSVVGGLAIGGGLLVFTCAYERLARDGAFGGGDIKLLAALGFCFGAERGMFLLLLSCGAFSLWMAASALRAKLRARPVRHNGPFAPSIAIATCVLLAMG
jgi:leader peptidase (prepilin peptidase)/N-methyltransferase